MGRGELVGRISALVSWCGELAGSGRRARTIPTGHAHGLHDPQTVTFTRG